MLVSLMLESVGGLNHWMWNSENKAPLKEYYSVVSDVRFHSQIEQGLYFKLGLNTAASNPSVLV